MGELLGRFFIFGARVDDRLDDLPRPGVGQAGLDPVLAGQPGPPLGVAGRPEVGPDLVVDGQELGRVVGREEGQVAGARMEVLLDDRIAFGFEGEELESDVDSPGELLLELVELPGEVEAVRAEEVDVFDDLDRRVLERLGRLGGPIWRQDARGRDLGQAVVLLDDFPGGPRLRFLPGVMVEAEAVSPGDAGDGEDGQELDRRPDELAMKPRLASMPPPKRRTQDGR
jgi:hypothetical protein